MNLHLISITNDNDLVEILEELISGSIMIDLERLGKKERQAHRDTLISDHNLKDIVKIRKIVKKNKLMVRINPYGIHTKDEIEEVINLGVDSIMLPMVKDHKEVESFTQQIDGRAESWILLETIDSLKNIELIVNTKGVNRYHIGLNDLHIEKKLDFMFELLSDGTVEQCIKYLVSNNLKCGFGGIGIAQNSLLDPKLILSEHKRINSSSVILSRNFYINESGQLSIMSFEENLNKLNDYISSLSKLGLSDMEENRKKLSIEVKKIVNNLRS